MRRQIEKTTQLQQKQTGLGRAVPGVVADGGASPPAHSNHMACQRRDRTAEEIRKE
jgi:hypothetical protein